MTNSTRFTVCLKKEGYSLRAGIPVWNFTIVAINSEAERVRPYGGVRDTGNLGKKLTGYRIVLGEKCNGMWDFPGYPNQIVCSLGRPSM